MSNAFWLLFTCRLFLCQYSQVLVCRRVVWNNGVCTIICDTSSSLCTIRKDYPFKIWISVTIWFSPTSHEISFVAFFIIPYFSDIIFCTFCGISTFSNPYTSVDIQCGLWVLFVDSDSIILGFCVKIHIPTVFHSDEDSWRSEYLEMFVCTCTAGVDWDGVSGWCSRTFSSFSWVFNSLLLIAFCPIWIQNFPL